MFAILRTFLSASLSPGLCVDAQKETSGHRDSQEHSHRALPKFWWTRINYRSVQNPSTEKNARATRRGGSRRILLSSPTWCARIESWIGSTLPIGRRSLRSSSQSALLSSRSLSSRSLDGRYYAGLDRSLNARVDPTNTPRARPCARRTIAATELARIPLTSGNPET